MRIKKRLLSIILAIVLAVSGTLLSPTAALSVHASSAGSAGSLIGSGAADEINILRILDMALNKSGIVMSSGTIRSFLEFWWSNVRSDIQTIISDADTTITTVSDFIKWVESNWTSTEKPKLSKVAEISLRFLKYCALQESKTLSDYKQLITQEGTFRDFLLSYVTDVDGNLAGTVNNNKLAKYNLKSGLISMARQAADAYIEEHEGYYLVKTYTYKDFLGSMFDSKDLYYFVVNTLKTATSDGIYFLQNFMGIKIFQATGCDFVGTLKSGYGLEFYSYSSNWDSVILYSASIKDYAASIDLSEYNPSANSNKVTIDGYQNYIAINFGSNGSMRPYLYPVTSDGRTIKVWKTLNALKNASVGKSDIYYSKDYSDFEESKDTGLTFTGAYYNSSYSHETIQNTIDNSQTIVDNSVVNNIVNNYITNNYYGDGSGSGDSDDNPGSGWNLGEGITAFVKGIAELLDFLLKLLGDLVGLLASFATSVLDILKSLAVVGSSFGDFLKEMFSFLPEECISLIISSIGAMCVVGVIKAFKK